MIHKETLAKVRSQMELPDRVADTAVELSEQALLLIEQEGVSFEEYSQIGFLSHLFNMTLRMEQREHLAPIDADVMEQLESEPLRIADRAAAIWTERFGDTVDDAERALIAIHLQTAIMKQNKKVRTEQNG